MKHSGIKNHMQNSAENWINAKVAEQWFDLLNRSFEGRITKGVGGQYDVVLPDGRHILAVPRGVFRKADQVPVVGDLVRCTLTQDPDIPARIEAISPRKNLLIRPPLANIDSLLITFAVSQPMPDLALLDKLLIVAGVAKINPVICLTKADVAPELAHRYQTEYTNLGFDVLVTDLGHRQEIKQWFNHHIQGQLIAFAGPSGVGKSTLFYDLVADDVMSIGEISDKRQRGKHTTRHVYLHAVQGGFLTDTPGFTSLSLLDLGIEATQLSVGYPEWQDAAEKCHFNGCTHRQEPNCAVKQRIEDQKKMRPDLADLFQQRYERYVAFYNQLSSIPNYERRKVGIRKAKH